jgi:2-polyprenyl-3-methyl-5-hydroxy-6-metoxy-1,4-benzoquinol methylase
MLMENMHDFYNSYWEYSKRIGHLAHEGTPPGRLLIAQSMITLNRKPLELLDVGCGGGGLGRIIRDKFGDQVRLTGVDISGVALEMAAKQYDHVIKSNIENGEFLKELQGKKFDYIVCLEVLEHLFHPVSLLNRLKDAVTVDGFIIISAPNFAFYRNRYATLKGDYPMEEILFDDIEHLHHWTYYSLLKLFQKTQLKIVDWDCDYDMPLILKALPLSVKKRLYRKFPNFFGNQIIFKATNKF